MSLTRQHKAFRYSQPFLRALATRATEVSDATQEPRSEAKLIEQLCLKADPRLRNLQRSAAKQLAQQ